MSWVYKLTLTEHIDAEKIQTDWENISEQATVQKSDGGVIIFGTKAVIVSNQTPEFDNMESLNYVQTIEEYKEIPSDAKPPIELGFGFELMA